VAPTAVAMRVLSWASEIDEGTVQQAARAARLPFVVDHVALMPDAHVGVGATVGSVIPTDGAVIPAAVGVDIGCGMVASETDLIASDLPESLRALMPVIEQCIPAGVGKAHTQSVDARAGRALDALGLPHTPVDAKQRTTLEAQFATLGSGNHFVEVCLDERDHVWVVLHSGSRGIGNQLAQKHIGNAKGVMKQMGERLEDPDLAYFLEGTPEFAAYIADMLWAQDYAYGSRALMVKRAVEALFKIVGKGRVLDTTNCHHNFTQVEDWKGRKLWITRKGAIQADAGRKGVIPGSMGTKSYIVSGLGDPLSWNSCSHGAGRRMSRSKAKKTLTVESLREAMAGKDWLDDRAEALVDEHPLAYKDIDVVMEDQKDLVQVEHTLRQIFNYKGL